MRWVVVWFGLSVAACSPGMISGGDEGGDEAVGETSGDDDRPGGDRYPPGDDAPPGDVAPGDSFPAGDDLPPGDVAPGDSLLAGDDPQPGDAAGGDVPPGDDLPPGDAASSGDDLPPGDAAPPGDSAEPGDISGVRNLSLGRSTFATSIYNDDPALTHANVTDGDLATYWDSRYPGKPGTYVEVMLGDWFELHAAVLHLGANGTSGAQADFELQVWDGCWLTVPGTATTGNPSTSVTVPFTIDPPLVTPRVRFVCNDTSRCELRELELDGVGPVARPSAAMLCPAGQQVPGHHPNYAYAQFLPVGYNADRDVTWPIIFAYHGIGGMILNGTYTAVQANPEGLPRRIANDATFRDNLGAIVISLHCRGYDVTSGNCWFNTDRTSEQLHHQLRDYLHAPDQVSVTGLSGGGIRGWDLVIRNREVLAAFIPICSDMAATYCSWTGSPDYDPVPAADGRHLCDLIDFPIRAYHGTADGVVPYGGARATLALDGYMNDRCDATSDRFYFDPVDYDGSGHSIWNSVYNRDEIYTWLWAQRLSNRPAP